MAIDGKYGQVELEHGDIGDDEPVFVFRARDRLLPMVLQYYHGICGNHGAPPRHLDLIKADYDAVKAWQEEHPEALKTPDSEASREWLDT